MPTVVFLVKAGIYLITLMLSYFAMGALDFSRYIRQGHTTQAQILYALLVMSLAWLSGSFVIAFLNL